MKKLLISTVMATTLLTGCATIVSKSDYPVKIQSQPTNAEFVIKNRAGEIVSKGLTPKVVVLKAGAGYFKGEKYTITFKKQGLPTQSILLDSTLDGWYIGGNFLFGGLIGHLIVDPLTGAMYKLPEAVNVNLGGDNQALNIISINTLSESQKEQLIKLN